MEMDAENLYEEIEQLVERRKNRRMERMKASELDEEEEDRLLSNFLSQLSTLKAMRPGSPSTAGGAAAEQRRTDELAAELRKLKRQNTITHCLLTAMIVITGTWQLSEVSLLLILKNRLTSPFKSAANLLGKVLKGGRSLPELQILSPDSNQLQIEGSLVPPIAINFPSLPRD
ncbi:uncharacterized protein LOC144705618 [Wolffia australiana]